MAPPERAAYLDHAATTPVRPEVVAAVAEEMAHTGNPSSLHAPGRRARRVVEESREAIAAFLRVTPSEVIFTAGGTESNNIALKGLYWQRSEAGRRTILTSAIEHHAVLDPLEWIAKHEGANVVSVDVDQVGRVDPAAFELSEDVALVSVMWANNEVGTIQPIEALSGRCRDAGVPLHSDAVQAVGVLDVDAGLVDALTLSGHKFGGPVGVGALVLRRDVAVTPLLHGGGQERDVRSGTLDVASIRGLAVATEIAGFEREARGTRIAKLRDDLTVGVQAVVPDARLNGDPKSRLPGNAHFTFPGCEGDALLLLLDAAGVACSTGSACTAGIPRPSHVLLAMGLDDAMARGSLRFSLGHASTSADIDALLSALPGAVERAKRAGR